MNCRGCRGAPRHRDPLSAEADTSHLASARKLGRARSTNAAKSLTASAQPSLLEIQQQRFGSCEERRVAKGSRGRGPAREVRAGLLSRPRYDLWASLSRSFEKRRLVPQPGSSKTAPRASGGSSFWGRSPAHSSDGPSSSSSSGASTTTASVVSTRPPMLAAFCSAQRATFAASSTPAAIRSP